VSGPLSHVRVLDLSRVMAGPWSSQNLADLGADVIKVERPGSGDDTRAWGPPFLKDEEGRPTAESAYYLCTNRAKRSIELDLSTSHGQSVVRELAKRSDIVLENYKVGTLNKYGLDAASLHAINPRLIYCSITGFGQTGPRRAQAAYDFAIQAMGGLMSITGERDDQPGGGPQKVGVPIIDLMTGMYATIAMLAALARRAETDRGEIIDIAMLDVAMAVLANQGMNYLLSGNIPKRTGNCHPNIQPQDVFTCRDGKIVLAVGNDGQFAKLCAALGQPDLASDPRFCTNPQRVRNLTELLNLLRAEFATGSAAELAARLDRAGVPCATINDIQSAMAEPQIVAREMVRMIPHPQAGKLPQIVSPMRFQNEPLSFDRSPPLLGQHTQEILAEIGMAEPTITGRQN
jgi:crotonobetainyl-CoA:carnitine CoA-transferase CaiB-like acyl-CoA transferase